jgi:hypothetical protein
LWLTSTCTNMQLFLFVEICGLVSVKRYIK